MGRFGLIGWLLSYDTFTASAGLSCLINTITFTLNNFFYYEVTVMTTMVLDRNRTDAYTTT